MTPPLRALGLTLALATVACSGAPPPAMLAVDVPTRLPAEYDAALTRWTRGAQSYEHLVGRVFVRATWFSPAFADAFVRREEERLGLPGAEAAARREGLVARAREETRFLVALNTHDPRWSDLRGPEALLRLALRRGDAEVAPVSVERVRGDLQTGLVPFFPYVGPLTAVYWVSFPPAPDPNHVTLRIAGAPAVIDLEWKDP